MAVLPTLMEVRKDMQSPQELLCQLVADAAQKCSTHLQYQRDIVTISRRSKNEGMSFLTITLPNFLQDFMLGLEEGRVSPTSFIGWKKRGCLPVFLQGFTRLIFNAEGEVENESETAIHCVRQICSFFKKVKLPCTDKRTQRAFCQYVNIEDGLDDAFVQIPNDLLSDFCTVSNFVISTLFPREVLSKDLIPHHGPGSTAERIIGNAKYVSTVWPERLLPDFTPGECLFSSDECYYQSNREVEIVKMSDETPVRVITVPKTLKTPRIIALEPVAMQLCQQGVKDFIVETIEKNPLTAGHINFSDQTINRNLALLSSKNLSFATLDMSAASDRIHKDSIYLMLSINPSLRDLVFRTRSRLAELNGVKLQLCKFASMGSALCFPMEALYFTILCVVGRLKANKLSFTPQNIRRMLKRVYVYGDDIIVPVNEVDDVVETLSNFGNVVGLDKSFYKGRFRESCGMDAYNGIDITPIYLRNMLPTSRVQAARIVSSIETANHLYKRGFVASAHLIANEVEDVVGKLPTLGETSEGLGWHFDRNIVKTRFNHEYQRLEVKTLTVKIIKRDDPLTGYGALCKCLINLSRKDGTFYGNERWKHERNLIYSAQVTDADHLTRSPSFGTLTLKSRWVAAR